MNKTHCITSERQNTVARHSSSVEFDELLERSGQHQSLHLGLQLLPVPAELVPDDSPGHVLQCQGEARGKAAQVPQFDFTLAPH